MRSANITIIAVIILLVMMGVSNSNRLSSDIQYVSADDEVSFINDSITSYQTDLRNTGIIKPFSVPGMAASSKPSYSLEIIELLPSEMLYNCNMLKERQIGFKGMVPATTLSGVTVVSQTSVTLDAGKNLSYSFLLDPLSVNVSRSTTFIPVASQTTVSIPNAATLIVANTVAGEFLAIRNFDWATQPKVSYNSIDNTYSLLLDVTNLSTLTVIPQSTATFTHVKINNKLLDVSGGEHTFTELLDTTKLSSNVMVEITCDQLPMLSLTLRYLDSLQLIVEPANKSVGTITTEIEF